MIEELRAYLAQSEKNYSEGLRLYAKLPNRDEMKLYRFSRKAIQEKLDIELQRQLEKLEYGIATGKVQASAPAPTPEKVEETLELPISKEDDIEGLKKEVQEALTDKTAEELQYLHNQIAKLSNSLADAPSDAARFAIIEEMQILEGRQRAITDPETEKEDEGKLPREAELPQLIMNCRSRISRIKKKIKEKPNTQLESDLAKEEANLAALRIELDGLKSKE